ncbi:MAG: hypothetical protein UW98_C0028G0002 [Parcubacteria group bacterium GW2011_GWC2_45_15]|nr:MAG: hypothetical protein UW98_C0028G0002 [Parcubacteria group bacterium GW2011_GWC2_45_15]
MLAVSGSQFGIELTGSAAENIGSLFFNPWLDSLIILGAVFFFGWLVLLLLRKILMRTSKAPATFQRKRRARTDAGADQRPARRGGEFFFRFGRLKGAKGF